MIQKRGNVLNGQIRKNTKQEHTLVGYASTYNVEILNSFNPEVQLKDTESAVKSKLIELSIQLKGFPFVATLALVFKKIESKDKKNLKFLFKFNRKIIINESDIDDALQSNYTIIITNIQNLIKLSVFQRIIP